MSKKRKRKLKSNPSSAPRANPPIAQDIMNVILPGFGAFALARFATRAATMLIAKKKPSLAKHAGALASLATFGAAWFAAHRIKALAKYHDSIVFGTGLATLQTLIQTYMPGLGWVVSDVSADLPASAAAKQLAAPAAQSDFVMPADPSWYSGHEEAYDQGRFAEVLPGQMETVQSGPPKDNRAANSIGAVDELLAELGNEAESSWSFGN